MIETRARRLALVSAVVTAALGACVPRSAPVPPPAAGPTLEPEVLVEGRFTDAEGLAFNGEGRLFVAADDALWEVLPDGATRHVAAFDSNLGLAAYGPRDLLMADFGPEVWPRAGPNSDGTVWRVTPEGEVARAAGGIGDPNAIAVLPDRSFLVSDDFTRDVYRVTPEGEVALFTDAVAFPNGLALAPGGRSLYVAQIFSRTPDGPPPVRYELEHFDDRVWRLPLDGLRPAGAPEVVFRTGAPSGPDGLAFDDRGRLYLSAARAGELWRIDLATGRGELLAKDLPGLASLAFGRGAFDSESLYAAQIRGGRVLRFRIGARGAPLHR